jgi:hypothetical protein
MNLAEIPEDFGVEKLDIKGLKRNFIIKRYEGKPILIFLQKFAKMLKVF